MANTDDNDLNTALRAQGCRELQLPHWAQFAALEDHFEASSVDIFDSKTFSQHDKWVVPCDSGCSGADRTKLGKSDTLHCFTVSESLAQPLNQRLFEAALRLEAQAEVATPADGAAGVLKTNWGGFQTRTSIFDAQDDPTAHDDLSCCRELHSIASAAIDEIGMGTEEYPEECPFAKKDGEPHAACALTNAKEPIPHILHLQSSPSPLIY
jgi:hypothetical protein